MSTELRLATKVQILLDALVQWKCPACGGSGTYQDKGFRGPSKSVFMIANVTCKKCGGNGRHPIAHQAIEAAGET